MAPTRPMELGRLGSDWDMEGVGEIAIAELEVQGKLMVG